MKKKISTKVKNILWATDFSKESKSCLPYIKFFSGKLKTKNHALYILPKFSDWVYEAAFLSSDDLIGEIEKTKQKSMKKIMNYSRKIGVPLKTKILEGIASEEIIKYSNENDVDLVFAGRRGISEIEQILIGSTTSRLVRNSDTPIFVVPKFKREVKIEKILSPVDFNELSLPELKYSIAIAKQMNAKVYVAHVSEFFNYRVPVLKRDKLIEKINTKILEIAEQNNYNIENIIYDMGEPAQKIIEISKKNKIDLIVMASNQRKGFDKFFLGSITEKVIMYSNIPILVLPLSDNVLS